MGPVALPSVPTYKAAYGSLGNIYDPQTKLVNQEIAQLVPAQKAQQAALDQAKVNAFKDINTEANSRGLFFSGFTPAEEASYLGTKYLPATANLKTTFGNQKLTLVDKINQINAQRSAQAQGMVGDAQKALADAQYKNAQYGLAAYKAQQSAAKASIPTASEQKRSDVQAAYNDLASRKGADNKVAPDTWQAVLENWVRAGYTVKQFVSQFSPFINPNIRGKYTTK